MKPKNILTGRKKMFRCKLNNVLKNSLPRYHSCLELMQAEDKLGILSSTSLNTAGRVFVADDGNYNLLLLSSFVY